MNNLLSIFFNYFLQSISTARCEKVPDIELLSVFYFDSTLLFLVLLFVTQLCHHKIVLQIDGQWQNLGSLVLFLNFAKEVTTYEQMDHAIFIICTSLFRILLQIIHAQGTDAPGQLFKEQLLLEHNLAPKSHRSSQTLNSGWARKEHFLNFSSFSYILSHFSFIFFLSSGWAARCDSGKPYLRHWGGTLFIKPYYCVSQKNGYDERFSGHI